MINDVNCIPCPSAFYRREVIEKVGWFGTKGSDYDYWIRVGKVFPIHRIEKTLSNFRVHKESQTGAKETCKMWLREDYLASRWHGASIFSPHSRRYYKFVIINRLRPILGFTYPWVKNASGK